MASESLQKRALEHLAEIERAVLAEPAGDGQAYRVFQDDRLDDDLRRVRQAAYGLSQSLFPGIPARQERLNTLGQLALLRHRLADLGDDDLARIRYLAEDLANLRQAANPSTSEPAPEKSTSRRHPSPDTSTGAARRSI